jgi:hypothetical protein
MALQVAEELRRSPGYQQLDPRSRHGLDRDLMRIESALGRDPYAQVLDARDLESKLRESAGQDTRGAKAAEAPAPAPPPTAQTAAIGRRAADVLEAVNFPGFVASLITGTFQAIVDASAQQVREYAKLVASITQSLEEFSQENVTENQARDHLAEKFPQDLVVVLPAPGRPGSPRLVPRPDRVGESPQWLSKFKLEGHELTEELTEGPLLAAARLHAGEERLQTLATLVLMGINRVVVNEGDIRAKIQFHAAARDVQKGEVTQQGMAIAARSVSSDTRTQMMVSTAKANAQAEASIKADLVGEVRVSFRSEVFPLERFADSAAIQLLNRHARWRTEDPPAAPAAPDGGAGPSSPKGGAP